jgi:hypothetical protein
VPTVEQVGVIFTTGSDGMIRDNHIFVQKKGDRSYERIPWLSQIIEPLTYALLFSHESYGWSIDMERTDVGKGERINITRTDHFCYRTAIRKNEFNPLLRAGPLTCYFYVDSFVRREFDVLNWYRNNQKILKSDTHYDCSFQSIFRCLSASLFISC